MMLGTIDLDAIIADGPEGLERLRQHRDRLHRALLIVDGALRALEADVEDGLGPQGTELAARLGQHPALRVIDTDVPDVSDTGGPPPAPVSSRPEAPAAASELDSLAARGLLQRASPASVNTIRETVLAVYIARAGEWLKPGDLNRALPDVNAGSVKDAIKRLRALNLVEHNGHGGSGGACRYVSVDDHGHEGPLEGDDDEPVAPPRPLSLRPPPAPEPPPHRGELSVANGAATAALPVDPRLGTLEGRALEALAYKPARIADLARRLRISAFGELRELRDAINRLIAAGDLDLDVTETGTLADPVYVVRPGAA